MEGQKIKNKLILAPLSEGTLFNLKQNVGSIIGSSVSVYVLPEENDKEKPGEVPRPEKGEVAPIPIAEVLAANFGRQYSDGELEGRDGQATPEQKKPTVPELIINLAMNVITMIWNIFINNYFGVFNNVVAIMKILFLFFFGK